MQSEPLTSREHPPPGGLDEALCHVLAGTSRLALQTSLCQWNAGGRDVSLLRSICERQREELWRALDPVALRIRMLGGIVWLPPCPDAEAEGEAGRPDPGTPACRELAAAHRALVEDIRAALDIARAYDDEASAGLLRMRLLAHDRHLWELDPMAGPT